MQGLDLWVAQGLLPCAMAGREDLPYPLLGQLL